MGIYRSRLVHLKTEELSSLAEEVSAISILMIRNIGLTGMKDNRGPRITMERTPI